ncbi:unnamed protein product, partial [marine sediment metagenome]
MKYQINEVYRSYQGEGFRTGTENVFVRFTGCNLRCQMKAGPKSPGDFDCDTEFMSGRAMTMGSLLGWIQQEDGLHGRTPCRWVILTGGEPGLQVDETLIDALHDIGFQIAIETNGSILLPAGLDYISVSPKVAEHCIKQTKADEVRYVRGYGQSLPKTAVNAQHKFISPAFVGDTLEKRTLDWCTEL